MARVGRSCEEDDDAGTCSEEFLLCHQINQRARKNAAEGAAKSLAAEDPNSSSH
ncbi:hypothetical protein A2U01_0008145, partial [Trifolium medium]|nr:hypothetical protein [Trifolium medium]